MVKKTKLRRKGMAKSALTDEVKEFTKPDQGGETAAINRLLVGTTHEWKEEFKQPTFAWKELKRRSEKFDIEDPFWADHFLKDAIEQVETQGLRDDEDVPYSPDRELTLMPTMGPQMMTFSLDLREALDPNTAVQPETPRKTRRDIIRETQANATPMKRLEEVTDEGMGMYNSLAYFLQERNVWNAELDASNFDEGSSRPVNTTAALIQPDETLLNDLAQIDKALDNLKLQREDVGKAKKTFGIEEDADILNIPGMRISKAPTEWQLVAADAMYDAMKDETLKGMLIADDVGLGKTWSCMTFLLKVRTLWKVSPRLHPYANRR